MYLNYFKLFGIDKYLMRFSTHDPAKLGQKFVDEPELWKQTEEMTRRVLKDSGINYVEVPNEAAFYGPKIDVQAWSVIGREFSIATNQVDFAQPRNFDLRYKDRDNADKIPICMFWLGAVSQEKFKTSMENGKPLPSLHSPFFAPLFAWLRPHAEGYSRELSDSLAAFLNSEKVNARTDDDKTFILATRIKNRTADC